MGPRVSVTRVRGVAVLPVGRGGRRRTASPRLVLSPRGPPQPGWRLCQRYHPHAPLPSRGSPSLPPLQQRTHSAACAAGALERACIGWHPSGRGVVGPRARPPVSLAARGGPGGAPRSRAEIKTTHRILQTRYLHPPQRCGLPSTRGVARATTGGRSSPGLPVAHKIPAGQCPGGKAPFPGLPRLFRPAGGSNGASAPPSLDPSAWAG